MRATSQIIKSIEQQLENGHTLKSAYQYLISNLDEFGTAYLDYNHKGFRLFYTTNSNFAGGINNGYGAGFYARIKYLPGLNKDIKLPTSFPI